MMPTWAKTAGGVLAAAALFLAGYRYAAAIYNEEMAALREAQARAVQRLENEQNAKLIEERERAAQAASDLLAQVSDLERRNRDSAIAVDRMQRELARQSRLPSPGTASCRPCEERYARCAELLSEGVGLADEGRRLAEGIAARKDAIAKLSQGAGK